MDVKTLSTIIGHVSSSTTLNVYAHVTDEMRRTAAVKIDQGIGKADSQAETGAVPRETCSQHLPGPQGPAAQSWYGLCHPDQRKALGRAVLPDLARRSKARPQRLRS